MPVGFHYLKCGERCELCCHWAWKLFEAYWAEVQPHKNWISVCQIGISLEVKVLVCTAYSEDLKWGSTDSLINVCLDTGLLELQKWMSTSFSSFHISSVLPSAKTVYIKGAEKNGVKSLRIVWFHFILPVLKLRLWILTAKKWSRILDSFSCLGAGEVTETYEGAEEQLCYFDRMFSAAL